MSALRLRIRLLWLAYAWPFRWAHKPLCDRFHEGVLHVGRLHLCRGCTFLYTGFGASAAALAALRPNFAAVVGLLVVVGTASALGSHPALYDRWLRPVQDALRFATGAIPALAVTLFATGAPVLGALAGLGLAALYTAYARARSERKARACDGCPELGRDGICSGFQLQAAAARAYDERCTAELAASGFVPPIPRQSFLPRFSPTKGRAAESHPGT